MTKVLPAFRNFANAPLKSVQILRRNLQHEILEQQSTATYCENNKLCPLREWTGLSLALHQYLRTLLK
jgi:hypothetical protein